MIKLMDILRESMEDNLSDGKNLLTSSPDSKSSEKFTEITEKVYKHFKKGQIKEQEQFHNNETESGFSNMLKPAMLVKHDIKQYIGEYDGPNFPGIVKKLGEMYEKAGFTVEQGYGIDDIKGFEVKTKEGEVVGEVDFLTKDSIPNHGDTIIIKTKKIR